MMLVLVSHIEGRVQHTRRARVAGELDDSGAWAGKLFLVVEEGWALTASPAAGAWLNEYARRSRHYALWLIFISQHFKDLANEQGRALLGNSVLRLCLQNDRDDLDYGRDTIGLTDTDIEQITTLPKQEGVYSTVYVVSRRGRGAVRISLADLEYWICSSRPRARPATPRPSAQRLRRGPLASTTPALHPRMARHLPRPLSRRVMQQLITAPPAAAPLPLVAPGGPPHRKRSRLPWLAGLGGFMLRRAPGGAARRRRQPAVPSSASARDGQHPGRRRARRGRACTPSRCGCSPPAGIRSARRCTAGRPTPRAGTTGRSAPPASPTCPRTPTASPSSRSSTTTRPTAARFTFADANALSNLPYLTALRVANNGVQKILYKRDVGYGQGPGQLIANGQPYRLDVWWQSAGPLGVSKNPVEIELAPATGAGATLGQLPASTQAPGASIDPGAQPRPAPAGSRCRSSRATRRRSSRPGSPPPPQDAPAAVKATVAAANRLYGKPYIYGSAHGSSLDTSTPGYDCSSAVSYVLYTPAGALGDRPRSSPATSTLWGLASPGPATCTVYANSGHAFMYDRRAGVRHRRLRRHRHRPTPATGPRWRHIPDRPSGTASPSRPPPTRPLTDARLTHSPPHARRSPIVARDRRLRNHRPLPAHRRTTTSSTADGPTPHGRRRPSRRTRRQNAAARSPRRPSRRRTSQRRERASTTPQAAIEQFAALYINWTWRTLAAHPAPARRELSVGPARLSEQQAAAAAAADSTIAQSQRPQQRADHLHRPQPDQPPSEWVIVTREQTAGNSQYDGLQASCTSPSPQLTHTHRGLGR